MSAKTVRSAIQTFLQAADTPGLTTLYRSMPYEIPSIAYCPNGQSFGAAGYIWLMAHKETVVSVGGAPSVQPNGWRAVTYAASVVFDWRVLQPDTDDDSWTDGLDDMVDAVKVALRSDPTLGTTGDGALTIFTAANAWPDPEPSITVILETPLRDDDSAMFTIHGSIDFPVIDTVQPG